MLLTWTTSVSILTGSGLRMGVWSLDPGVWSTGPGVWSSRSGVRSVEACLARLSFLGGGSV